MNNATPITVLITSFLLITTIPMVFADTYQEKIDFASSLEETLGHFWALEQNLDEGNSELAIIHASHPITELYDSMKPELLSADPQLDAEFMKILTELQQKTSTNVSREQAQQAIDDAKEAVEIARSAVVGEEISENPQFKLALMKILLQTSIAEYHEAVSDGFVGEMAEFQDGSAFVWRSQQIYEAIKPELDEHLAEEIDEYYEDLWDSYEKRLDPPQIEIFAGGIIHEVDEALGVEEDEKDLVEYVETIKELLEQTKQEYGNGNTDLALSLATKAYLDNYEFLEAPLIELGEEELMDEVEVMLREDLRSMIRNGESSADVNAHIDGILEKIDTIAKVVPEFGTITMIILAAAIIGVMIVTTKSKITLRV